MANRRCFSTEIIHSKTFLELPPSSQALYLQLLGHADDDGIVEAFMTLRICSASMKDLQLLHESRFVVVLNADLVSYIEDWQKFNTLDRRYKKDSKYQKLLVQVRPDVEILKRVSRDRKLGAKNELTESVRTSQELPVGTSRAAHVEEKRKEEKRISPTPPVKVGGVGDAKQYVSMPDDMRKQWGL
ncbi:hypothetical protein P0G10_18545 [Eubacteriales bacterium DFI.9.88]|nr:hypothetical protein [Eubacteriales bacterium DFI.9.88]